MLELLTQPLTYPFVLRGLLAVVLVGVLGGAVGTFVVLRGMAFLGDALAHAILPGVAVGYLVQGGVSGGLFWWALGTAIAASLTMGAVARRTALRPDAAIGVVFAALFALGIALISAGDDYAVDLSHLLFGNLLGVSSADLLRMALLGGFALVTLVVLFKEFVLIGFDPVLAASLHVPVKKLEALFLVLVAITVVVALQAVGVALTMAMLVTPAATALLLTGRLSHAMALAAFFGAAAGAAGVLAAYYLGIAPGAAVVLAATVVFGVVAVVRGNRSGAALAAVVIAVGLAACDTGNGTTPGGPLGSAETQRIVATTPLVAEFVRAVAGPEAEVTVLVPPGADVHAFQPTAADAAALSDADLVFAVGPLLETFLPPLLTAVGRSPDVVWLGALAPDAPDPHVWLDPKLVAAWPDAIARALAGESDCGSRCGAASAVRDDILALDREIEAQVAEIPPERRLLVADHPAWGNFARRYGFEILGTVTGAGAAEPVARELTDLAESMKDRRAGVILVDAAEPSSVVTSFASDLGAEVVPVYVDGLGPEGSGASTYADMMRLNTHRIVEALAPRE